ncbi:MAG: SufD family Fe-S cluster assembly protein [Chlamydiales bacterium]|nr:SufD family Fe-S cluster assembly protein [Chlamydiales bacterium]
MTIFDTLYQSFEKPLDALADYRRAAWEALKLPLKRQEPFKYMQLAPLWETPFTLPTSFNPGPIAENTILFINGRFCGSRLPKDIVVLPLTQALKTYSPFLKKRMALESDPFALLSQTFTLEGVFIYIPPALQCPVLHIVEQIDQGTVACPRIHLRMGKHSVAKLKLQRHGQKNYFSSSYLDLALDEGAHLTILQNVDHESSSWQFDALRAELKTDSQLKAYYLTQGAACVRSDMRVLLQGENASATLKGLNQLTQTSQAHQHIYVEHAAPNAHSNQHFKTVLKDESRASFEGKIYVQQLAQQTLAYQLNNNLLFGKKAIANSKPNLEIFADDVKASHGTTMTRLNQEELFYLKSRGLNEITAQGMLEKGFCQEILQEVQVDFN